MNSQKKIIYTNEFNDLLGYMVEILGNEFPCKEFTLEHLIISIFDKNKCHANLLLSNFLGKQHIKKLKSIYVDYLTQNSAFNFRPCQKSDIVFFNKELDGIITNSQLEYEYLESKKIGSEHILLALLNSNNGAPKRITDVFNEFGIDYQIIRNKSIVNKKDNMDRNEIIKTIKSQVNPKATSSKTEFIEKYTINLNTLIKNGKIDSLIGRDKEVGMILKVLSRRKKNNVILVGAGGCGKTQIVNGVAERIVRGEVPSNLRDKEIVQLNVMSIVSGTNFRGMMEERVKGLFDELKESKRFILFLDDIQQVIKTSNKDKDTDLSAMIGDILAEGDVSVIGTTTFKDYRNGIESNSSLNRKFQKIVISPNTKDESINIIGNIKNYYEDFHSVIFPNNVIKHIVDLAERYVTDRTLPDSAIDILDLTGANVSISKTDPPYITETKVKIKELTERKTKEINQGRFEIVDEITDEENTLKKILSDYNREKQETKVEVTCNDVAKIVSEMTNIPVSKLSVDEKKKMLTLDATLKEKVIGQDEAIDGICKIIKRNRVGLGNAKRVMGAILMTGQSGVGKCVTKETKIKIRNKKTLEIQELTIEEFMKLATKA